MKNVLLVVSGPSGVGKGTMVKTLIARRKDVVESVSCTTRPPRNKEVNGKHYFFLSKEEFQRRIKENDFLEYDVHFDNYYGTPKSFVINTLQEKSVIMEIDVVGGFQAKESYPDCILVMVAPPSMEELRRRLRKRGTETPEQIEDRLSRFEYEMSQKDKYDYLIVNDDLETAIKELENIIDGEKNR